MRATLRAFSGLVGRRLAGLLEVDAGDALGSAGGGKGRVEKRSVKSVGTGGARGGRVDAGGMSVRRQGPLTAAPGRPHSSVLTMEQPLSRSTQ